MDVIDHATGWPLTMRSTGEVYAAMKRIVHTAIRHGYTLADMARGCDPHVREDGPLSTALMGSDGRWGITMGHAIVMTPNPDPDPSDPKGSTRHRYPESERVRLLQEWLDAGGAMDATTRGGRTIGHLAAQYDFPLVLKAWLDAGGNPQTSTEAGETIGHCARGRMRWNPSTHAYGEGSRRAVLQAWVSGGGDVTARNRDGDTIMHGWERIQDLSWYIQAGGDIYAENKAGVPVLTSSHQTHVQPSPAQIMTSMLWNLHRHGVSPDIKKCASICTDPHIAHFASVATATITEPVNLAVWLRCVGHATWKKSRS
jgi:hypothetical protein